jgi:hypothetical protein
MVIVPEGFIPARTATCVAAKLLCRIVAKLFPSLLSYLTEAPRQTALWKTLLIGSTFMANQRSRILLQRSLSAGSGHDVAGPTGPIGCPKRPTASPISFRRRFYISLERRESPGSCTRLPGDTR